MRTPCAGVYRAHGHRSDRHRTVAHRRDPYHDRQSVIPRVGRRHAHRRDRQSANLRGGDRHDHQTVAVQKHPRDASLRDASLRDASLRDARSQGVGPRPRHFVVPCYSSFVWESPALVGRRRLPARVSGRHSLDRVRRPNGAEYTSARPYQFTTSGKVKKIARALKGNLVGCRRARSVRISALARALRVEHLHVRCSHFPGGALVALFIRVIARRHAPFDVHL